jgi:hypothetical protein
MKTALLFCNLYTEGGGAPLLYPNNILHFIGLAPPPFFGNAYMVIYNDKLNPQIMFAKIDDVYKHPLPNILYEEVGKG